jgi:nucleoporin SEH1
MALLPSVGYGPLTRPQVKWNGPGPVLGSCGSDLRLKIWREDPTLLPNSGRRFSCLFSQSSAHRVVYVSLDFVTLVYETYLAAITRDGLLSLLEPVSFARLDDWKELDQFWVCEAPMARGAETSFRVSFQQAARPAYQAIAAGLDPGALSVVVAALDRVKVYRVVKTGPGGGRDRYRFQAPVAELVGAAGLVRDVAWAQGTFRKWDLVAAAAADGMVRVYEVGVVRGEGGVAGEGREAGKALSGIGAGLAGRGAEGGMVRHEGRLVAELAHEGVWRVEWVGGGERCLRVGRGMMLTRERV